MYEWAKDKPEYEEEKERYLQLNSNYSEDTINKLAFFRFSSKVCTNFYFENIHKRINRAAIDSFIFKYVFLISA